MEAKYAGIALTGPTSYEHLTEAVRLRTRRMVEQVPLVDSDVMRNLPLGNRSRPVRLLYRRDFDSYIGAAAAAARLDAQLPDQGLLVLSDSGVDGTVIIAFPDACVSEVEPVRDGIGYAVAIDFLCSKAPSVVEGPPPPPSPATWATWDSATWQNLNQRTWLEAQVA